MARIRMDFGDITLWGRIGDDPVGRKFIDCLPRSVDLTRWGQELYGPLGLDLGEHQPVPDVPSGGIAYSRRGGYLCLFFGQTPAWPVDIIGRMEEGWKDLDERGDLSRVTISRAEE